jgi:hypothetical protein
MYNLFVGYAGPIGMHAVVLGLILRVWQAAAKIKLPWVHILPLIRNQIALTQTAAQAQGVRTTKRKDIVRRKRMAIVGRGIAGIALLMGLCGCSKRNATQPVVCLPYCTVYLDSKFKLDSRDLSAGTEVTVLNVAGDNVQIKYSGGSGWVKRYALCSRAEYHRRKQADELPESITTIVYRGGNFYMTGGSMIGRMAVVNGQLTETPGQGIWMDESTDGHPFSFGSTEYFQGDNLYFIAKANQVVYLPVWKQQ